MAGAMTVCALLSDRASAKYWEEAICQIIGLHEDDNKSRLKEALEDWEKNLSQLMSDPDAKLLPQKDCSEFRLDKSLGIGGVAEEREKS